VSAVTPAQRYALRAALRFAWSRPTSNCALVVECRERRCEISRVMRAVWIVRNDVPWSDPSATSRPLDKHGQPVWNEGKINTIRRRAWVAAVEATIDRLERATLDTNLIRADFRAAEVRVLAQSEER